MCHSPISKSGNTFACGKCDDCNKRYIADWTFRLEYEARQNPSVFLTLTYDYDNMPFNKYKRTLHKPHYQNFLKRLRKALPDRTIKYVCCGEYGEQKGRPHYHLLMFGVNQHDFDIINKSWGMGSIHMGTVTPQSISYVFKYSVKGSLYPTHYLQVKPFVAMSKGLGEGFAFDVKYKQKQILNKFGHLVKRTYKERTIKPHFQSKLDNLLVNPFYQREQYKLAVPRFYIRVSGYDKTEYIEHNERRILEKSQYFDKYPQIAARRDKQLAAMALNTMLKRKSEFSKNNIF